MKEQDDFLPVIDIVEKYIQPKLDPFTQELAVPTGFHDLDKYYSGLYPSDLIILGGVPTVVKSDLVLNIALNASGRFNQKVGFFS